jgi:hypothetical protein
MTNCKQYMETKQVTAFLHYSEISEICSDYGSILDFYTV